MPSLGNDLAAIRKSRGLSIEEVHRSTKIPKSVLTSIEDDSIFADIGSSPTYIRSYVRSYAKILSIREQKIVYALDKMEKESYEGSLIDAERRQNMRDKTASSSGDGEGQKREAGGDKAKPDSSFSENSILNSREVGSVDWADMGRQFKPKKRTNTRWRMITVILALLLLGVFLIYWFYLRTANSNAAGSRQIEAPTRTTTTPDSLQLGVASPTGEDSAHQTYARNSSAQFRGGLPDTLSIVLYAAYGDLEPVRVYTDILDKLNPYWIKNGEAIRFNFVNSFQFRGGLDHVILFINGHPVNNFREQFLNPETGRIEITRSSFENNSEWLQPPPDTLDIDVPPPPVIHHL